MAKVRVALPSASTRPTRDVCATMRPDRRSPNLKRQPRQCREPTDRLPSLGRAHRRVGTHSIASDQLGAGQAAAGALFYLVKYFTKDLVKINPALSVLRDARQTIETHGSRAKDESQADGTERVSSKPLTANGTLTDAETSHLLLQFMTVAANDAALIFVLANQKQRHSVIRSVKSRVKSTAFEEFFKLTDEPGFWEKLDEAADDPESMTALWS